MYGIRHAFKYNLISIVYCKIIKKKKKTRTNPVLKYLLLDFEIKMSTSKNQKGRNGLRILWIPGKKKNHHKGRFDSTNKTVTTPHKQKNIEPWTMGGVHGQNQLIKT